MKNLKETLLVKFLRDEVHTTEDMWLYAGLLVCIVCIMLLFALIVWLSDFIFLWVILCFAGVVWFVKDIIRRLVEEKK